MFLQPNILSISTADTVSQATSGGWMQILNTTFSSFASLIALGRSQIEPQQASVRIIWRISNTTVPLKHKVVSPIQSTPFALRIIGETIRSTRASTANAIASHKLLTNRLTCLHINHPPKPLQRLCKWLINHNTRITLLFPNPIFPSLSSLY